MKKFLVTGGAGFIGSNFIKYVLKKDEACQIVNLDALTYAGNLENLKDISTDARNIFVKGDISDRDLVAKLFKDYDFDYVVNFAAESHVDRSIEDPELFLRTNIMGTQCLLDAAKKCWQTGTDEQGYPTWRDGVKFLQVSTDEVYGALGKTGLFSEATPLAPNSPYSASKAAADMIVRAYNKTFKMPLNITRCSNNYGPYQFPEKLIPLMFSNARDEKHLPVYGDGKQVRDWLYVDDHCSAIYLVLMQAKSGEVYNIGGNNEMENIQIVNLILANLKKSDSLIKYVRDRQGHDRRYAIDASKIKADLGWEPTIMFDQGIEKTIAWYLENEDWLSSITSGDYIKYYEKMYFDR
jgi:dTDP-glucose 4,6-dehydratase